MMEPETSLPLVAIEIESTQQVPDGDEKQNENVDSPQSELKDDHASDSSGPEAVDFDAVENNGDNVVEGDTSISLG